MKLLFKLALLLFVFTATAQQTNITGKITDNLGEPLPGVNVIIENTKKGTQTDIDGNFNISTVKGTYNLKVSFIGFKTRIIKVNSPSNNNTIKLYEGNELLQEVEVVGRTNSFSRKKTAYVSKLPLKDIENPQVYSTVTSDLLESQVITNIDDALVNATGISKLWEATGRAPGEGTGYFATRGFATQPKLVDGLPGFTLSAVDPSYIERIEVVKGPAATLFGSTDTSLGGLINIVTKKPYEGFGGSASYTTGSFGTHRVSADINVPLSEADGIYFRLNTSYLTQDSFQDAGFRNTFFVAPSFSFRVNNKLNISAGIEFAKTKQTNPSMLFINRLGKPFLEQSLSAIFGNPINVNKPSNVTELNVDPTKSYTSDDVYLTTPTFNTRTIVDYKISDEWTSQTVIAGNFSETTGYYQYNIDGGAIAMLQLSSLLTNPSLAPLSPILTPIVGPMVAEAGTLLQRPAFTRIYDQRDANATNFNIQQNFIGDFKIADMRNRLVVGLDYVTRDQHSRNKNGNPSLTQSSNFPQLFAVFNSNPALVPVGTQLNAQLSGLPYFDAFLDAQGNIIPSTFTPNATYTVNKSTLDNIFNQLTPNDVKTSSETFAAYVSDVINITPELTVNLGLRLDYFNQDGNTRTNVDDFTKTTLSPQAGIVYQVLPNKLSVFGNYQTGFINQNPTINQDGTVNNFKPAKANQFEGGFKTNLFRGKLNLGASYYHITVNDRSNTDPQSPLFPIPIDIAEVVSKGIELEANANPLPGLNLRASYSYNDSKITDVTSTKTITDRFTYDTNGNLIGFGQTNQINELYNKRPEEAGPQTVYNFWADYKFQEGSFLENFGVGAGFNGASEHLTINNSYSGTFELPSYTVYNASAYYDAEKFRIGFKVNNLSDEVYYKGWSTVNAQASRAFLGTLTYKF